MRRFKLDFSFFVRPEDPDSMSEGEQIETVRTAVGDVLRSPFDPSDIPEDCGLRLRHTGVAILVNVDGRIATEYTGTIGELFEKIEMALEDEGFCVVAEEDLLSDVEPILDEYTETTTALASAGLGTDEDYGPPPADEVLGGLEE